MEDNDEVYREIRGHHDFVSLRAMFIMRQTFATDLESLIYTILYACDGTLPWSNTSDKAESLAMRTIATMRTFYEPNLSPFHKSMIDLLQKTQEDGDKIEAAGYEITNLHNNAKKQ